MAVYSTIQWWNKTTSIPKCFSVHPRVKKKIIDKIYVLLTKDYMLYYML